MCYEMDVWSHLGLETLPVISGNDDQRSVIEPGRVEEAFQQPPQAVRVADLKEMPLERLVDKGGIGRPRLRPLDSRGEVEIRPA